MRQELPVSRLMSFLTVMPLRQPGDGEGDDETILQPAGELYGSRASPSARCGRALITR